MAFAILFTIPFTGQFYVLYILCGLTDMIDGYVARRTKTESDLGAKLDSVADACFVLVCMIKILPVILLDVWLWVWIAGIALIKVANLISGFVCQHRLVMLHTVTNKGAGFLLFMLPLLIGFVHANYIIIPVCAVATFAAIQEGHLIRTMPEKFRRDN